MKVRSVHWDLNKRLVSRQFYSDACRNRQSDTKLPGWHNTSFLISIHTNTLFLLKQYNYGYGLGNQIAGLSRLTPEGVLLVGRSLHSNSSINLYSVHCFCMEYSIPFCSWGK